MSFFAGTLFFIGLIILLGSLIPLFKDIKAKKKTASPKGLGMSFGGIIMVILAMIIMPSNDSTEASEEQVEQRESVEEVESDPTSNDEEVSASEDEPYEETLKYDNATAQFTDHAVTLREVYAYEKDGQILIDLDFMYDNQSFGEETTFLRANSMDVKQKDLILEEANNAWFDPMSDVTFPNAGGPWPISFTYIVESTDEIKITLIPHNDYDDNYTFSVDLNLEP